MSALDLDQLSEYLDGDHNEYGLDFAATHGFLCAIAVGLQFDRWLSLHVHAKLQPKVQIH